MVHLKHQWKHYEFRCEPSFLWEGGSSICDLKRLRLFPIITVGFCDQNDQLAAYVDVVKKRVTKHVLNIINICLKTFYEIGDLYVTLNCISMISYQYKNLNL